MAAKVRTIGEQAMYLLNEPPLTERQAIAAQAWAVLDLAEAVREAGKDVAKSLDFIEASVAQLAAAVQRLD